MLHSTCRRLGLLPEPHRNVVSKNSAAAKAKTRPPPEVGRWVSPGMRRAPSLAFGRAAGLRRRRSPKTSEQTEVQFSLPQRPTPISREPRVGRRTRHPMWRPLDQGAAPTSRSLFDRGSPPPLTPRIPHVQVDRRRKAHQARSRPADGSRGRSSEVVVLGAPGCRGRRTARVSKASGPDRVRRRPRRAGGSGGRRRVDDRKGRLGRRGPGEGARPRLGHRGEPRDPRRRPRHDFSPTRACDRRGHRDRQLAPAGLRRRGHRA